VSAVLAEAVGEWNGWNRPVEEDPTRITQPALLVDPTELARAILGRIDEMFDEIRLEPAERSARGSRAAVFAIARER